MEEVLFQSDEPLLYLRHRKNKLYHVKSFWLPNIKAVDHVDEWIAVNQCDCARKLMMQLDSSDSVSICWIFDLSPNYCEEMKPYLYSQQFNGIDFYQYASCLSITHFIALPSFSWILIWRWNSDGSRNSQTEGANVKGCGANLLDLFGQKFSDNYIKMKEIGLRICRYELLPEADESLLRLQLYKVWW